MKRNAGIVVTILVVLALGVWGYTMYRNHTARTAVIAFVKDAGERLRAGLQAQPPGGGVDFDAHARAVDEHIAALRRMSTSSFLPLADAADDYLVTVREILRRQAALTSSRERLSKDLEALKQHVQADRGAGAWVQQAVQLKAATDKDLRDYRIASESYASLLGTLPASQAKIAPHVDPAQLMDENVVKAVRASALPALARTDENIKQLTRIDGYRGRAAPRR